MFRWDDLRVLLAAHRHGSIAAAARALDVDASTASRRLRTLEEDLGAQLFDRTPEGLQPTATGLLLRSAAEQAEATAREVEAVAAGTESRPEGIVRVACPDAFAAYVLAPGLRRLLDAMPGLDIEVLASTDLVDLRRREADVAVRMVRPTQGDLVVRSVASTGRFGAFVTADYAASCVDLTVNGVDWIGWDRDRAHLPEARAYAKLVGKPPRLSADNLVIMIEAMRAGAGALLLPRSVLAHDDSLVEVPGLPEVDLDLSAWVVTHQSLQRVPRIRAVMDWLVELLESAPLLRRLHNRPDPACTETPL